MRLLSRFLLILLSLFLVLTVLWFSLPRLIISFTHAQLSQLGYTDIELVMGDIGVHSATVERLRMSNDEFAINLQGLSAEYRIIELLSGNIDSLILEQAVVTRRAAKNSDIALPDPLLLLALLRAPWDEYMLAHSLRIRKLSLLDAEGVLLLQSSIDIDKRAGDLSGRVNLLDSKQESHLMRLEISAEKGVSLQLQSATAADDTAPLTVSLQPAQGMNGLTGQANIDLAKIRWLLPESASLSGRITADLSYLNKQDEKKKTFSLLAEIKDAQFESWQIKAGALNIQGSIEETDTGYRLAFAAPSSLTAQSLQQDNSGFERLSFTFPQRLEIVDGQLLIASQNGASLSVKNARVDEIRLPQMQLSEFVLSRKQENNRQTACGFKMLLTAPLLKRGDYDISSSPMQLEGDCTGLEKGKWSASAEIANLGIEDAEVQLALTQCRLQLASVAGHSRPAQTSAEFSGDLSCASSELGGMLHSTFQFSPESGAGKADYTFSDISPGDDSPLFVSLWKDWKESYDLVSGKLSLAGQYRWWKDKKAVDRDKLILSIKLIDGGGFYDEVIFSGMQYRDQLQLLPFIKSSKYADLEIKDIDVGVPVTSTKVSLRFTRSQKGPLPLMIIKSMSLSLLDGKVLGNDLKIDLNNEQHKFTLVVDGLDISEIVELQQLEGLTASGRLDGYIPVTVTPKGLKITEGKIVSQPQGGQIHYRPQGGTLEMEKSAIGSEFVFRIIEDLKYDSLNIDVDYKEDGELEMKLAIKGKSPKVDANRPIHFNLNLQQNILKLLEGLRYAEDLSDEIDKNAQKNFSKD